MSKRKHREPDLLLALAGKMSDAARHLVGGKAGGERIPDIGEREMYVVEAHTRGDWLPLPQYSACNLRSAEAGLERARHQYRDTADAFRLTVYGPRGGAT